MPYIKSDDSRRVDLQKGKQPKTAGELNYQIFWFLKTYRNADRTNQVKTVISFVDNFLYGPKNKNYQRYNDMTGCLIRCQKEVKRRLGIDARWLTAIMETYDAEIDDYEDACIKRNGDV